MDGVCHKIYRKKFFVFQMMLIQMNFSWVMIAQKLVFLKMLMCITQFKSKKKKFLSCPVNEKANTYGFTEQMNSNKPKDYKITS